jgi:alpha-glucosidase (family GH31 glycosyl hydrolase)
MWNYLKENGIKGGFWTWDCILKTGNEVAFSDFKERGFFSNIYTEKNAWHNLSVSTGMTQENKEHPGTECGNIDFDSPKAVAYFKQQMKHFFDEGADFIKLDRTSKISVCKAMFEMSQEFGKETKGRGFVLSHTFETETEDYKRYPTKWTDDTRSDWTNERSEIKFPSWAPPIAFKENIAMYTDTAKATSKIPFLTNDMGGYEKGSIAKPDDELYIRWLQFSLLNPITEVFSAPENPTSNLPWLYSDRADSIFRKYSHLRLQLFPYIYSYAHKSRIEGKHMIGKIPGHLYQYMFGDELMVVPVYEKGVTVQKIFLPKGKWINYWTGEQMNGNAEYMVAAPISQAPLFVKQGAVIPMRQYASSVEKGNNETIMLDVYPGADGQFNLIEDDGSSNDYLKDGYATTKIILSGVANKIVLKINPLVGSYKGMKKNRKWILHIHGNTSPQNINVNGKELKFKYLSDRKITITDAAGAMVSRANKFEINFRL